MTEVNTKEPDCAQEATLYSSSGSYSLEVSESTTEINTIEDSQPIETNQILKTSKRRWLILIAMLVFGLTNFMVDNQSAILDTMLKLLDISIEKYVNIGVALTYLSICTTLPSAFIIDRIGIRKGLYLGLIFYIIKNLLSALLFNKTLPNWEKFRRFYWIFGSLLGNLCMSFYWCLPLKIAETWFPANERSFSWSSMNSATNIGLTISSFAFPRLVGSQEGLVSIYYIILGATIVTSLTVLTFVTKSKPKYPPSERMIKSSQREKISHLETIKRMLAHKDMMLHVFHSAVYDGMVIAVLSVKQDIMLASGYSRIFIGNLMAMDSLLSIVMVMFLSMFIHKVNNILLMCKFSSLSKCIVFPLTCLIILYPVDGWWVVVGVVAYNILRSWATPNYANMTAHLASGNVSEATASSFTVTLLIIVLTTSRLVFIQFVQYMPDGRRDYTRSIMFACLVLFINTTFYLIFFDGSLAKQVTQEKKDDIRTEKVAEVENSKPLEKSD